MATIAYGEFDHYENDYRQAMATLAGLGFAALCAVLLIIWAVMKA